jgi:probable F420-dependent oxidoreductase
MTMQIGVTFPQTEIGDDPDTIVAFVRAAEAGGFSFLMPYDHVLGAGRARRPDWSGPYDAETPFHEVFVLFGFLAAITELELVSGVLVLPQRQTALVAKQAAEVDVLTRGRFRLGVGIGWNEVEYQALGTGFRDRAPRYEEQIEVLRLLWTHDVVTFTGRYHEIDDAGILPRPVQQPIPIWMGGGSSPAALERIGRLADGWIANAGLSTNFDERMTAIREAAARAGRDPDAIGAQGVAVLLRGDSGDDVDGLRAQVDAARARGLTHLTVLTMNQGRTPREHVDAVQTAAAALAAG